MAAIPYPRAVGRMGLESRSHCASSYCCCVAIFSQHVLAEEIAARPFRQRLEALAGAGF